MYIVITMRIASRVELRFRMALSGLRVQVFYTS